MVLLLKAVCGGWVATEVDTIPLSISTLSGGRNCCCCSRLQNNVNNIGYPNVRIRGFICDGGGVDVSGGVRWLGNTVIRGTGNAAVSDRSVLGIVTNAFSVSAVAAVAASVVISVSVTTGASDSVTLGGGNGI